MAKVKKRCLSQAFGKLQSGQKYRILSDRWERNFKSIIGNAYEYAFAKHLSLIFIVHWKIGTLRERLNSLLLFFMPEQTAKHYLFFIFLLLGSCQPQGRLNQKLTSCAAPLASVDKKQSELVYLCWLFFIWVVMFCSILLKETSMHIFTCWSTNNVWLLYCQYFKHHFGSYRARMTGKQVLTALSLVSLGLESQVLLVGLCLLVLLMCYL